MRTVLCPYLVITRSLSGPSLVLVRSLRCHCQVLFRTVLCPYLVITRSLSGSENKQLEMMGGMSIHIHFVYSNISSYFTEKQLRDIKKTIV